MPEPTLLYLDQNYLSGIAKRKPAFDELEPVLRDAISAGAVAVLESAAHRLQSAARADLPLPQRASRDSDRVDFEALAIALPRCRLVTCDAFMADVVRRAGLDRRFG